MSRICWILSDDALGEYHSENWGPSQLFIPVQSLLHAPHDCKNNKLCGEAAIPGDTHASYCEWELGLSAGGVEHSLQRDPLDLRHLDLHLHLHRSPTPVEVQS
jgi:hypothetical protein